LPEDIHDSLKTVFKRFDHLCKEKGCFYDIVSDEADLQGYVLKAKKESPEILDIRKEILPLCQELGVHLQCDEGHSGGPLFTFTLEAIKDEGHWKKLSSKRKRHEFSPFSKDYDAKDVRAGKSLAHKGGFSGKLEGMLEAQYKSPITKHRRSQMFFPSAINKKDTKTFGGHHLEEGLDNVVPGETGAPAPIAGRSIPRIRDITGTGRGGGVRSTAPGESKKVKPYSTRKKNASSLPKTPPIPGQPPPKEELAEEFFDAIDRSLAERTIPSTRVGRTNDPKRRQLTTFVVPDATEEPTPDGPESFVGSDEFGLWSRIEKKLGEPEEEEEEEVVYDDEDDSEPQKTKRANMMRPIGVFGPADARQPSGGVPGEHQHGTNVRTQHPPDRSFDANTPKIAVTATQDVPLGREPEYRTVGRLEDHIEESLQRPEDGYEFMQLLVKDLGMVTNPRKIVLSDRTYVKACDGELRLEFDHPDKLTVYRRGKRIKEIEVDLGKDTVVDEASSKVLAG
jgi:hypothetical protein